MELLDSFENELTRGPFRNYRAEYRDKKHATFRTDGAFSIGKSLNARGAKSFETPHPWRKDKGVYSRPIVKSTKPAWMKRLYALGGRILRKLDPEFAQGDDWVMHVSRITSTSNYVKAHVDAQDASYQIAISFGPHDGELAKLGCRDAHGEWHAINNHRRPLKMDGRLSHRLELDPRFAGTRFSLIFFKLTSDKPAPDPVWGTPCLL